MLTDLNIFYSSEPVPLWKRIIGEDLHYHFGYFEKTNDFQTGLKDAVRNFYPFIPKGTHVLDLGCGWGGPAKLLREELDCSMQCLTISETQYHYCKNELGLDVSLGNIEEINFNSRFDIVMMIESLEHILDKPALFQKLQKITNKLIIRTSCMADHVDATRWTYGDSMYMSKVSELVHFLENTGWGIAFKADRRFHAIPTISFWKKHLENEINHGKKLDGQLHTLYTLVKSFEKKPIQWCQSFPLMDIVATCKQEKILGGFPFRDSGE